MSSASPPLEPQQELKALLLPWSFQDPGEGGTGDVAAQARQRLLLHELKDRSQWFVRVRWYVPPLIWLGLLVARGMGVELPLWPVLLISLLILGYNLLFQRWHARFVVEPDHQTETNLRTFTKWQVALDFLAIFLFVHYSGGGSSPFLFFFIFHIIFASILLKHGTAHAFAAFASLGMGLLMVAEGLGWVDAHPLIYRGSQVIALTGQALPAFVAWAFFAFTMQASTYATTSLMEMVRRRIGRLAELSEAVLVMNNKQRSLHTILHTIVGNRHLEPLLELACRELAAVLEVQGVSVKLLSEDGRRLRYAASYGLPARFAPGQELDVDKSPLNRRILEGEPFTTGGITEGELFQLGEAFAAAQLQSVLFVPLRGESQVIGILGAYSKAADRFGAEDLDFLKIAGEVVAVALENARAFDAVEALMRYRERFTFQVAHNLRAPLAAMVSMMDLVRLGFAGEVPPKQAEYLERVRSRATALNQLVNELMLLASQQAPGRPTQVMVPVDVGELADQVATTFQDRARERQIDFQVEREEGLPPVLGDSVNLELLLENLVSNALKYTPSGGRVGLRLWRVPKGPLRFEVSDTGIGIPLAAQARLFSEFFRAENAKAMEAEGTGLGLVIVQDIVRQHGGQLTFRSVEGQGTTFTVTLPAAPQENARSVE